MVMNEEKPSSEKNDAEELNTSTDGDSGEDLNASPASEDGAESKDKKKKKERKIKDGNKAPITVRFLVILKPLLFSRYGKLIVLGTIFSIALLLLLSALLTAHIASKEPPTPKEIIDSTDINPRSTQPLLPIRQTQLAESILLNPVVEVEAAETGDKKDGDDNKKNKKTNDDSSEDKNDDAGISSIQDEQDELLRPTLQIQIAEKDKKPLTLEEMLNVEIPKVPDKKGTKIALVPNYNRLPELEKPEELPETPFKDMVHLSEFGFVPKVTETEQKAWFAYAREYNEEMYSPRLSIVIYNLGLDKVATAAAIQRMPPEVTLSFSPYAHKIIKLQQAARKNGHEIMLDLQIEKSNEEIIKDPGYLAILIGAEFEKNKKRFERILALTTGYTGLFSKTEIFSNGEVDKKLLTKIKNSGLMYITAGSGVDSEKIKGLPWAKTTIQLDEFLFKDAIDAKLELLARTAIVRGYAIGYTEANPLTLNSIANWLPKFKENGIKLAPVSALVTEQK